MAVIKPLLSGLAFTLKTFFTKPITYQYPEQKRDVAERWRGLHRLKTENGQLKCVACGLCEAVCPANVITVEPKETADGRRFPNRFVVEVTRCIFCGYCQEACPKDAIELTRNYEFCGYTREEFHMTRDVLTKN
ncbi:MAG: NADH-quinone oxidoreductase subunit NuoI [Deferrisomatales bacterium]|nr:NADH-quinone oxidoreductase subunit NuoI [Deferrisomatales bacterium]